MHVTNHIARLVAGVAVLWRTSDTMNAFTSALTAEAPDSFAYSSGDTGAAASDIVRQAVPDWFGADTRRDITWMTAFLD